MGDIVSKIFTGFTDTITNLASGVKNAFVNILYENPEAEAKVLSSVAEFGLVFLGISMAIGLVYGAIRLVKGR